MRRAIALVLLLIVAAAAVVLLLPERADHGPASTAPLHQEVVAGAHPVSAPVPAGASPAVAATPVVTVAAFNRRLRCGDVRQTYQRLASPDVLALLCQRKPLAALAIELPLAEAGDLHAIGVLARIADGGNCNPAPPASSASLHARAIEHVQRNGASAETIRRLSGWLSEKERGPTSEEVTACRQAAEEMKKLPPEVAAVLGYPLDLNKDGGNDRQIDYLRKTLLPGDNDGAEELADALLLKGTPESDAEAVPLLRSAAPTSASAKAQLARCLLTGCPTPAADPDEALQLLTAAASEGNLQALLTLTREQSGTEALLPPADRYAWDQLLQKLNDEGCFGSTFFYALLAGNPMAWQTPRAMSPADAEAAQARARELLGAQLEPTRARLGCN